MSFRRHTRTFSQPESSNAGEDCSFADNFECTLLKSKLIVEQSLAAASHNRHRKLALDQRLKKFNCQLMPQASKDAGELKRPSSGTVDGSSYIDSRVSALGDLLQTQILKHEGLLREHAKLKVTLNASQLEVLQRDEEILRLRTQAKQQHKDIEGLRQSLKDVSQCADCEYLRTEIGQLSQALVSLQAEHQTELQTLEHRLRTLTEKSHAAYLRADEALVARVKELEDKLEDIVIRRSRATPPSLVKLLFRSPEVLSSSSQFINGPASVYEGGPMTSHLDLPPSKSYFMEPGEKRSENPTQLSENCSVIQSPNFSPLQTRAQDEPKVPVKSYMTPDQGDIENQLRRKTRARRPVKSSLKKRAC
jgi:hypothetical protein